MLFVRVTRMYKRVLWFFFCNEYCLRRYEGRSINFRTVLLSKHTVTAEIQNYYEVVRPLLYITYHGLIYDITL